MIPFRFLSVLLPAVALICAPVLEAALPVVSPGERIVFSDDFTANANAWTNIAVINGTGTGATGKASLTQSDWGPSIADRKSVSSAYVFKTPLNVSAGAGTVSVYMRVRVDQPDGIETNRFSVTLNESIGAPSCFVRLEIRPADTGSLSFRNAAGTAEFVKTSVTRGFFKTFEDYRVFKLTLRVTDGLKGAITTEGFYFDAKTAKYVSLGAVPPGKILLRNGIFDRLVMDNRNGEGGPAWFDSVVVTQGK